MMTLISSMGNCCWLSVLLNLPELKIIDRLQ